MPEEMVGKNVTVSYEHRVSHQMVLVYLACGRTAALEIHSPLVCYPAHGYSTVRRESHVSVPLPSEPTPAEFLAATFSQKDASVANYTRVFWSWEATTGGWQVPDNPFRTFRASPYLYKCYVIRKVLTSEEPLEGDPCVSLLTELLPRLDGVLLHDR
jgi:hypothetical protein